jgi:YidC/Oxa1 family membrane protein insertase
LILLYVGTQLASSLLMATPTMDKTQRQIMLVMPLFFVLFIIRFPAGVLVYWITTNTWTMAQQYVFKRRIAHLQPATVAGGPDASATGSGNGSGPTGGKDDGGSGGGIGALLRNVRGKPDDEADEPAKVGGGSRTSGGSRASSSGGSRASGSGGSRASSGSGSGGGGSGPGSGGSGSGGAQSSRSTRGTPPPSPRKRKKRSGRRR